MTTYATLSQFTQVYSIKGVSETEINSYWLSYGTLRVNEELGGFFTTPFSSNNLTATDLSVHLAYLGILNRTRNQGDSSELRGEMTSRLSAMKQGNLPMILSDGSALFSDRSGSRTNAWSSTQNYKNVFDVRDSEDQNISCTQINDLFSEDQSNGL